MAAGDGTLGTDVRCCFDIEFFETDPFFNNLIVNIKV